MLFTSPSSSFAIRSANPKIRASCVTITSARSSFSATFFSNRMITCPVSWSSALVGSSQTISRGS
jgi:hypothetical protein